MITKLLINALGQALFESCIQALVVYIALQMLFKAFPTLGSKYKYWVNYLALSIICSWFLYGVAKLYLQAVDITTNPVLAFHDQYKPQVAGSLSLLQQAKQVVNQYSVYITCLYAFGLIIHVAGLLKGLLQLKSIRSKKHLLLSEAWTQNAVKLANKLNLLKAVPIYLSKNVQVPLTIGFLKPIIIFPLALINDLDYKQTEAIVLHELAHIKRNDYLFNIVQSVMEAILCFNPFCYLIAKAIRNEREYCCDDMATNLSDNYSYASALYLIAQKNSFNNTLAMASAGEGKYPLLNRIKRLNTMKTTNQLPHHLIVVLTIIVLSMLMAWAIPQYSIAKNKKAGTKMIANPAQPFKTVIYPAPAGQTATTSLPQKKRIYVQYNTENYNDTVPKAAKKKYKIVIEDDNGNTKEYNSVDELPESARKEFLKENNKDSAAGVNDSLRLAFEKQFNGPEWKKQQAAIEKSAMLMRKHFNSPEWKKQQEAMVKSAKAMEKHFNSPEWKKTQEQMVKHAQAMAAQFNTPEWKKQQEDFAKNAEEMAKQFNRPEWKKQQEEMVKRSADMAAQFNTPEWKKQQEDMIKSSTAMGKQFNSPEWKKQMAEIAKSAQQMTRQFNSPEWKKQQDDMVKNALEIARQYKIDDSKTAADLKQEIDDLRKQQQELRIELDKAKHSAPADTIKR